ncbi:hypothetical protein AFR_35640 [Actinoplanes friuliensis DSM 7358]|uniref:Uncharacterized protein n=1 Tax=Actinoplanes friuliensis DSM 7358 TaxID=1246995 RepID=U5W8B4_9ACTN|nr:hypothetical protein AFR_35640 [Actinoplanes friuliensis DSM 7358]
MSPATPVPHYAAAGPSPTPPEPAPGDQVGTAAGDNAENNNVTSQQYGYGPFHGSPQQPSDTHPAATPNAPTSGTPPVSAAGPGHETSQPGPGHTNPTSGAGPGYGESPTSGVGPGHGKTPVSGPGFGGGNPTSGAGLGYGNTPTSGAGPGYGNTPVSSAGPGFGADNPTSGAGPGYGNTPVSSAGPGFGADNPTSGAGPGYGNTPTSSAGPGYGGDNPTSGAGPAYGENYSTSSPPSWSSTDPISGSGAAADPYGFSVAPAFGGGPRIEPTPKQPKGRYLIPALAGLVAGLLIFGTGGFFAGRATGGTDTPAPPAPPAPTATAPAGLGPYEQNQVALNQPKLTGSLAVISQGWLPNLSGCSRSGEKGGPVLNKGEKVRVRCEMDAMSAIFVEYATDADRDKARVKTLGQNVDARKLTPGVGPATERATPSGRTNGNYVEFAYPASGKTVSGIWWDDAATPVAAYLLAYWKEGTGSQWEPMRDIWARYA